jgi:hypothetical protein
MQKIVMVLIVCLVTVSGLTGKKVMNLDEVGKLSMMRVSNNTVFVSEGTKLHIYDLEKKARRLVYGKKGQGPGEFPYGISFEVRENKAFCYCIGKLVVVSDEGKYLRQQKINGWVFRLFPIKNGFISLGSDVTKEAAFSVIRTYNRELKPAKTILKNRLASSLTGNDKYRVMKPQSTIASTDDGFLLGNTENGFRIEQYTADGKKTGEINKDYKKIPISDEFKKNHSLTMKRRMNRGPYAGRNLKFIYPDHFPPFEDIRWNDDKIYVIQFSPQVEKSNILILDNKGKTIKTVVVPKAISRATFSISNGIYYYIVENEESETWELHAETLM